MNIVKTCAVACALVLYSITTAQVIAIPFKEYDPVKQTAAWEMQKSVIERMANQEGLKVYAYRVRNDQLYFAPELSTDSVELAADYVLKFEVALYEDYRPKLQTDEEKNRYFSVSMAGAVFAKLIDMQTHEVLQSAFEKELDATGKEMNVSAVSPPKKKLVIDVSKYLKDGKISSSELSKIYDENKRKIVDFHLTKKAKLLPPIAKCLHDELLPKYFPITSVSIEKDKAKNLVAECPYGAMLPGKVYIGVFSIDSVEGKYTFNRYGEYWLEGVEGKNLMLKNTIGSNQKDVAEAHSAGTQLYASTYRKGYDGPVGDVEIETVGNVGVEHKGWGEAPIETDLVNSPRIRVVDQSEWGSPQEFSEYYKQERFIDSRKTPNPIGADAMIAADGDNYNITSVETGELLGVWEQKFGFKGFTDIAMGIYDEEVTIREITKESKGKVKKFVLHNPWGFADNVIFDIYVIEEENVGGRMVARQVQIGECINYRATGEVSEFSVRKGEDEVYEAMQANKKIIFRHKEFKFLGQTFK